MGGERGDVRRKEGGGNGTVSNFLAEPNSVQYVCTGQREIYLIAGLDSAELVFSLSGKLGNLSNCCQEQRAELAFLLFGTALNLSLCCSGQNVSCLYIVWDSTELVLMLFWTACILSLHCLGQH